MPEEPQLLKSRQSATFGPRYVRENVLGVKLRVAALGAYGARAECQERYKENCSCALQYVMSLKGAGADLLRWSLVNEEGAGVKVEAIVSGGRK